MFIRKIIVAMSSTVLLLATAMAAQGTGQRIRIDDDSDWWSLLNAKFSWPEIKSEEKDTSSSHFQILGVSVGDDEIDEIRRKIGETPEVERGDASTGRSQLCYRTGTSSDPRYLIFERGEVNYAVYLISGGKMWNGSDRCTHSDRISNPVRTGGGFELGMTQPQVEAILGKPTATRADMVWYVRGTEEKTPAARLSEWRKQHPQMTDEQFHRNYDVYYKQVLIVVKFVNSKLAYLAISKSETY